jgi:hypothetical protein
MASLGSITLAIATKFLLCDLFWLAEGLQIDSQLLALLVEMAALEAQRAGYIGHVKIVAANLAEQHSPFKRFGAFRERARGVRARAPTFLA